MAFTYPMLDGHTTVCALQRDELGTLSQCKLPCHVVLVAQCEGNHCTYAYDGNQTVYNHSPLRQVFCPVGVTHLVSSNARCLLLTGDKRLYSISTLDFDTNDRRATEVQTNIQLKCIGQSVFDSRALGVSMDNNVYFVLSDARQVRLTKARISCDKLGPECAIASVVGDLNYRCMAVWDRRYLYYTRRDDLKQSTITGDEIKSCVPMTNGDAYVLVQCGLAFVASMGEVSLGTNIAKFVVGSYHGRYTVYAVFNDGGVGLLVGANAISQDAVVETTNCSNLSRPVMLKSARSKN